MSLAEYKLKRHFSRTPEPAGRKQRKSGSLYVIQKHDASRLHYDFRLELDGVLKSWAVPKGPSLDPSVKRLAVEVEDHPVSYGDFEGTIPKGEYGGGTVLLWDTGTWESEGDPGAALKSGNLKFILHGEKLQGGWALIRTRAKDAVKGGVQWLLIKERDDEARPETEGDVLEEQPLSVASGRDLDAIAEANGREWPSTHQAEKRVAPKRPSKRLASNEKQRIVAPSVESAKEAATQVMPDTIEVQLATQTKAPPDGDDWFHEIKFDGYRMICRIDDEVVRFISRNQQDWTERLMPMVAAIKRLPVKQAILDGEVVAVGADGTTDFQGLQNAFREDRIQDLKYYVFDLLYLDGQNLMYATLEERKARLRTIIGSNESNEVVLYSEHVDGNGDEFKRQACRLHLEGIVSKRRDQPYRAGRGYGWLKTKCLHKEEFVIGGYTEPQGARRGFGALLVGFHDEKGDLHYAGKVGTGFSDRDLKDLSERFQGLEQSKSPFVDLQRRTGEVRSAHWLQPSLVGQINYGSRTRDGRLRHASYQGLREDKSAEDVQLDQAVPVELAVTRAEVHQMPRSKTAKPGRVAATDPLDAEDGNGFPRSKSDSAYDSETQTFAGIRLTHPDKVMYPDLGITKIELARYFQNVADRILPHLRHRALAIVRCPDGQGHESFYQKHPGVGTPSTLR